MHTTSSTLTGLILCGGQGSRLGGVDKGLISLQGKPLVAHCIDKLRPQVDTLLISANRNHAQYAALGYALCPDLRPDFPGPLAGFEAGLAYTQSEWLVCTPCDTPNIPPDLAARLLDAARTQAAPAAYAHAGGRDHPVCCILHKSLLENLSQTLAQKQHRVLGWLQAIGAVRLDFGDDASPAFQNINTPAALEAYQP